MHVNEWPNHESRIVLSSLRRCATTDPEMGQEWESRDSRSFADHAGELLGDLTQLGFSEGRFDCAFAFQLCWWPTNDLPSSVGTGLRLC